MGIGKNPNAYYSRRDTVSSVGLFRSKVLPAAADGMDHVCIFRHALALDERRVKFLPEYVNEGLCAASRASESATPATKESKLAAFFGRVPTAMSRIIRKAPADPKPAGVTLATATPGAAAIDGAVSAGIEGMFAGRAKPQTSKLSGQG